MAFASQCQAVLEAHSPVLKPKFSVGRCTSFTLFACMLFLLCIWVGGDYEMRMRAQSSLRSLQLRGSVHSPPPPNPNSKQCDGRRIFIYETPPEFTSLLATNCQPSPGRPWQAMCEDVANGGFGLRLDLPRSDPMASFIQPRDSWFRTEQLTLELSFHSRMKTYPCLTPDAARADILYIPLYHSLDLTRNLYTSNTTQRDELTEKFFVWLRAQRPWQRSQGGKRHVLVLGRIYWDHNRRVGSSSGWGSALLSHPEIKNLTKVLIERCTWESDTMAIPYPTNFHPSSEAALRFWQETVRRAKRTQLVSFAASDRNRNMTGMVRGELFRQCANSAKCKHLICTIALCEWKPQTIYKLSLESVFCLQPGGDSPTRKGIFDTLISGCIPVLFSAEQAVRQYLWHLPGNGSDYSVMLDGDEVTKKHYDVVAHLEKIPTDEIVRKQVNILSLFPSLLYRNFQLSGEYTSKDAFDVTIDKLLERFTAEEGRDRPSASGIS